MLELSADELASTVDRLLDLEDAAREQSALALSVCERAIAGASAEERKRLGRALKQLRAGRAPDAIDEDSEAARAILALRSVRERADAVRAEVGPKLEAESHRLGASLRESLRDPRFREALIWQNRHALHTGLDALLRHHDSGSRLGKAEPPADASRSRPQGSLDKETRKRELTVASYLQRYCVKNDTIGFFGPVGWGTFSGAGSMVRLEPGASFLSKRTVYFEHWCISAVAECLAADPEIKPWLRPRRAPTLWVEGTTLHHPVDRTSEIPEEFARVFLACDGAKTAKTIAEELCADPQGGFSDTYEVYEILGSLEETHLITWTIELPPNSLEPAERIVRSTLEQAEGEAAARALASIDALAAKKDLVAKAAGDPEALDRALQDLEGAFTELTAISATRRGGMTYAGRTPVYEDCTRDVTLELGAPFLDRLGPPLSLLLQSARWYTFTVASRIREALRKVYRELRDKTGVSAINYIYFWENAEGLFTGSKDHASAIVRDVVRQLEARWAEILGISPEQRRLEKTYEQLAPLVAEAFAAPHPGWPTARYHSPDLMIAAPSVEAIARGEYSVVLGELHSGVNTFSRIFFSQYPDLEEFVRAFQADIEQHRVESFARGRTGRSDIFSIVPGDFDIEVGNVRSRRPRSNVLAIGDLVVEELDGRLFVRTRNGEHRFDIIAFFEQNLINESGAQYQMLPTAHHAPRVTIDNFIISRERWLFKAEECSFRELGTPAERFIGARSWARRNGLPRFVFFKVPEEPKPCYLDFQSPHFVELFARIVRKASTVSVSEMLPTLEQLWLVDKDGNKYTSELRTAWVDPVPFRAP